MLHASHVLYVSPKIHLYCSIKKKLISVPATGWDHCQLTVFFRLKQ